MKRSASLDFLRGAAAFAVAIPHYLTANVPFQPFAEAFAIVGVEVFFVLSGFVLAPQIVDWVVGKPRRNLGVFLVRRWMRTIPPYVVALVVIAVLTGNLMTADFVRYLFYVANLFYSANHVDFYPVAWSLAVEEWFYVLFAPALFLVARLLGRRDRRLEAIFALLVILVLAALRFSIAPHDWDLNVRRVTLFRIDSIVWGFLLYLALERRPPIGLDTASGQGRLGVLLALLAVAIPAELGVAILAVGGDVTAQRAFPYVSAAFGMSAVGVLWQAEGLFHNRVVRGASFYLGRISYSVYLFHLIVIMALKPLLASTPLALQLAAYVLAILALSTVVFAGFERPILAARPYYGGPRGEAAAIIAPPGRPRRSGFWLLIIALGLATPIAGVLARNAFMADKPYAFYSALAATAVLALALVEQARPFSTGAIAIAARAFLLFTLTLPFADALYRRSTGLPLVATVAQPTYSYRAAHANPTAFATWWFYYLNEWIREDGIRAAIDAPDPQKKLPFVLVPGSSGRMFDTTIHINNLGFRGPYLPRDKGDAFRIVALGESQTFGPTLRDGEEPWPELLQDLFDRHASCGRRIEVINGGTEAYTLENNLERMRRDVLPLKPDLIVSTHGMNGFLPFGLRRVPEPNEPGVRPRASALIGRAVLTIERAAHDWRDRNSAQASAVALAPMSDEELMKSRYADDYRKLITLSRESGADIALADATMAVNEHSPREVKDFYGAVFKPIDDIIAANEAHNRMVKLIARDEGAPLIDTAAGVDGLWDDDLYLDIVHFTERGNERVAGLMFRALPPILAERHNLRCDVR
ncbi:MAG TPA: acyltransferase family protein [Roseiarcus sp.]|jgi:peptidoglycan/LPS O-acetylase OafA/YrhL/lysophospholipase L1-like esterase